MFRLTGGSGWVFWLSNWLGLKLSSLIGYMGWLSWCFGWLVGGWVFWLFGWVGVLVG